MADLLAVVPTRGRPALMERFLSAWTATVQGDTDLLVVADEDEEDAYAGLRLPARAGFTLLPRMNLGPKLNAVCVPEAQRYRAVGFLADDCVPESPGWDAAMARALETPGIAYPEDRRRSDIPEHPFISSQIITALGWFCEPGISHYFFDNVLADLGRAAGCLRHVPDAVIPHLHYQVPGTGTPRDRTYAEAEKLGAGDHAAYQEWRSHRMTADVRKVRGVTGMSQGAPRPGWHPPAATATRKEGGMAGDTYEAVTGFVTDLGDGKIFPVAPGDRFPAGHPALRAGLQFFTLVPAPQPAPEDPPAKPAPEPAKKTAAKAAAAGTPETGPAAVRAAAAAASAGADAGA